jgi:NADH:ubiquinone oxidoreductase subunit C
MTPEAKLVKQRNFFLKKYVLSLKTILKTVIKGIRLQNNDIEIKTTPNNLRALLYFLQKHTLCQYKTLVDIVCSDVPGKLRRFTINYLLLSHRYNARLKIVVKTNEVSPLPSAITLYRSANWLEREVWDLYGVFFDLHPDLRRILTDYGFNGHPLRKDFPLSGFVEVYYNDSTKRLNYEHIELAQEYRIFLLQSPWNQNYKKEMVLPLRSKKKSVSLELRQEENFNVLRAFVPPQDTKKESSVRALQQKL